MSTEILEEDEIVIETWQERVEKLSDDEKRKLYKDLVRYSESDEYTSIKSEYEAKLATISKEIRELAYSREKCESTKSKLDMYVVLARETESLAHRFSNDTLKNYMLEARVKALDSAIIYKVEEGFDIPFHSDLDAMKNIASVYNSVWHYLDTCMGYYDVDTKLMVEKKMKEQEESAVSEYQPYS
jgi:hypothetical protein